MEVLCSDSMHIIHRHKAQLILINYQVDLIVSLNAFV